MTLPGASKPGGVTEARRFIPWETKREFNEFLLGDCGVTVEQMREKGYANFPFTYGDFEKAGFKTKTGKVELYSERLAELGLDPLPDYTPTRGGARGARGARRLPVDAPHRCAGAHLPPLAVPRPGLGAQGVAGPVAATAPGDRYAVPSHRGRLGLGGDSRRAGPLPPESAGHGSHPARGGAHRHGLVVPRGGRRRTGGALEVNINAAMRYDGPWDPVTGSADTRGLPCRIAKVEAQ